MEIEGKQLTVGNNLEEGTNILKCIICQQNTGESVLSSEQCKKRIRDRAEEIGDGDIVYKRLKGLNGNPNFVYHMSNSCYKRYTLPLSYENKGPQGGKIISSIRKLRSRETVRSKPLKVESGVNLNEIRRKEICIICNRQKYKGVATKFQLRDDNRIKHLLAATLFFQDDVYTRTCDLTTSSAVSAAKIYSHNSCMKQYLNKYDRKVQKSLESHEGQGNGSELRKDVFKQIVSDVNANLLAGKGIELSNIRDSMNQLLPDDNHVLNRDVKNLLISHFGEEYVGFTKSTDTKVPQLVYHKKVCTIDRLIETLHRSNPIRTCANELRNSLLSYDFGLKDKFCDANDIKGAWDNMEFPEPLLAFFSHLFDFKIETFSYVKTSYDFDDDRNFMNDEDILQKKPPQLTSDKCRKIMVLFQIMYFIAHHGRKRTPLHSLINQNVHETCKSKTLIINLNRLGLCSSYRETIRVQNDLATYTALCGKDNIPIPSNIDPNIYTIGGFDNWNHLVGSLSGMDVSNDTVALLFQNDLGDTPLKPLPKDMGIDHRKDMFPSLLPCQKLQAYNKPATEATLSNDYLIPVETLAKDNSLHNENRVKDWAYTLARVEQCSEALNITPDPQTMPTWRATNSILTEEKMETSRVGFLPVLPHPVTKYETVFTMMRNFDDVRSQLSQRYLAVACDEGVYQIARNIQLYNPELFPSLILFLGSFHMTKILLKCIGRYLDGSGANDIFVKSRVFGSQTLLSVLEGKHYTRSVTGMQLLGEATNRLFIKEFFKCHELSAYEDELSLINDLKLLLSKKDVPGSKSVLKRFSSIGTKLMNDLEAFATKNAENDETFRFWDVFRGDLIPLLNDIVRSDREGNWLLHLQCVQKALQLFTAFDCTNYVRWCSIYLEDMRKLPETSPEVYTQFLSGRFVVKHTSGNFKAVGTDMALEQTINRSRKETSGVLYNSKDVAFCTKWDLIHHEMVSFSHLVNEITGQDQATGELILHHEFSKACTEHSESNVKALVNFMEEHGNPFRVDASRPKLRNVVSYVLVPEEISKEILNCMQIGKARYETYRYERLVQKIIPFHKAINRINLKTFADIFKDDNSKNDKKKVPLIKEGYLKRKIEIMRDRGYDMDGILQYDLSLKCPLFNSKGEMVGANKSDIVRQLELGIKKQEHYPFNENKQPTCIVDVMNTIRKLPLEGVSNFGEFCHQFQTFVEKSSPYTHRTDYVFDSYFEHSIKDSERKKRVSDKPTDLSLIDEKTPILKNMKKFWPSNENKEKLQALLYTFFLKSEGHNYSPKQVVVSHMINTCGDFPCTLKTDEKQHEIKDLRYTIEEADARLLVHALQAINCGTQYLLVISTDTDVIVYLLHYWEMFCEAGLKELWVKAGVAHTKRFIPIHVLAEHHGKQMCKVLLAIHCLTGCDYTSKFGSKNSALKAHPTEYLKDFGKTLPEAEFNRMLDDAENFLVKVVSKNTTETTMDGLRKFQYRHTKNLNIEDLPITSVRIRPHILRAYFACHEILYILDGNAPLNPKDYGYHVEDNLLVPLKVPNLIPDEYSSVCSCKKCATKKCKCKLAVQKCTRFCACEASEHCRNENV